jgi:hypothetical protein
MNREFGDLSWFLVTCAILFVVLGMFIPGCGEGDRVPPEEGRPFVTIHCDRPDQDIRCFVNVHYATDVDAFYDDRLAWWDHNISNPEDRQSYLDGFSPSVKLFAVKACNDQGCTIEVFDVREYFADNCVVECIPLPGGGVQCITYCNGSPQYV